MPSSQFFYIPDVLNLIYNSPHQSILDIGPGFGKYGVLCREYFDLIPAWYEKGLDGFDRNNWQLRIDCIEVHTPYITTLHKYIYDNIYPGKAEDVLPGLDNYDLILMIGMVEHLEKENGAKLLEISKTKARKVIVVTPNGYRPQSEVWNNPYEEHKSGWSGEDLSKIGFKCIMLPGNKILAFWDKE